MIKFSLPEMLRFISKKKVFLIVWIIAITAIFGIFSYKRSEFYGEMIYKFPEPKLYYIQNAEMIRSHRDREQFKENYEVTESNFAKKFFAANSITLTKNYSDITVSVEGSDSTTFRSILLKTELIIDSLYITNELKKVSSLIENTKSDLQEFSDLKTSTKTDKEQYEQYSILETSMNNYYQYLVTTKYSFQELMTQINLDDSITIQSRNRINLVIGGFLFAIWTGLMIIAIIYFAQDE